MLANIIATVILLLIVGGACMYIYRVRKKGSVKCIGCPSAGSCHSHGGCGSQTKSKTPSESKTNA